MLFLAQSQEMGPFGKTVMVLFVIAALGVIAASFIYRYRMLQRMTPEERQAFLDNEAEQQRLAKEARKAKRAAWLADYNHGPLNPHVVCPHCKNRECVRTKRVKRDKGVSGGKAGLAVLTGGWSVIGTGLSNKEEATKALCQTCGVEWFM